MIRIRHARKPLAEAFKAFGTSRLRPKLLPGSATRKFVYRKRTSIFLLALVVSASWLVAAETDQRGLPGVPSGFHVTVYASEPLVRNPCAMAFDAQGRLFVGQGPQYRKPKPDSPTDRVTLLIDADQDGIAENTKTFAEGFNSIQGLAWYGDQLWIANAPDLTVVRDVDGDDVADEYRRVFGGLGNLEHALHGLSFAPDGWLYMSKGNSKGYGRGDSPERFVAPAPLFDLWGMRPPENASMQPELGVFSRETYQHGYHNPSDDWGTEGGVLRCRPDGTQLEVFSRGMRNTWDMNFDADFNWVGTDQDQDGGDRVLNPFLGAHFGWGHPWSPHWTGDDHVPTVPICGPVFHGSGTGVVFGASSQFPARYRNAFFCADWLGRNIFLYRPKWDGGMMRNMDTPKIFAKAPSGRTMGSSSGVLFDPTDIEFGPDGALWVLSWGHGYGAAMEDGKHVDKGRVYRISYGDNAPSKKMEKYDRPYSKWTADELLADLHHHALPVRRTNAQNELVRRGVEVRDEVMEMLRRDNLPAGAATWLAWTLGQIDMQDESIDEFFSDRLSQEDLKVADRIQAVRVLGQRARVSNSRLPAAIRDALGDGHPRIRFAAVQAIHVRQDAEDAELLWKMIDSESDRAVFYAARMAVREIADPKSLRTKLSGSSSGQRLAALLNLLEIAELSGDEVLPLRLDSDPRVAEIASSFVSKVGTSQAPVLQIQGKSSQAAASVQVEILMGDVPKGLHVRYTKDGSEPTDTTGIIYAGPFSIQYSNVVSASLFRGRQKMGPVLRRSYASLASAEPNGSSDTPDILTIPMDVANIRTGNGRPYKATTIAIGSRVYGNRKYSWLSLPSEIIGHTVIESRNGDSDVGSTGDSFLSFELDSDSDVYVAHDERITEKPDWLEEFRATSLRASTRDTTYRLFAKRFPPGKVQLGGNTRDGVTKARSQYVTIIKPAPLQPREVATTIEQSLQKLATASFRRGARLFFEQSDCAKCHRIGDWGNAFAPNLSNMGTRAAPKTIAESILDPSAVIMEGFHSVSVLTDDGKVFQGFIKQESGLNVELVQADGKVLSIPRESIELRKRQQVSVMPDGLAKQLNPQHVADLIRFIIDAGKKPELLQSLSSLAANTSPIGPDTTAVATASAANHESVHPAARADTTAPITFRDDGKALQIHSGKNKLATYIYQHDQVKRPFFAHVKSPSGTQVTRNFPPGKGDRQDHADMHPGIWLAFGDLDGEDFWRNKGRVVHKGFTQGPTTGPGLGSFSHRKSYQRADGSVVCFEDFRCVIRVLEEGYLLQWDSTFSSPEGDAFYFGDQEEMGLGIRVASEIAELKSGQIADSAGRRGAKQVWSQPAKWCDYSGTIGSERIGMTILCHPDNFRESWMHARNYGVIAANPFGRQAMKKGPKSRIEVSGDAGLRLQYGILLHGPTPDLETVYRRYVDLAGSQN
ncbi:MAG: PVC-type heme-binding CxxCH protein [Planctomycetota bacterium]|nr:PVC-type heme-binding CxxCH protein [Planctomycetota bacterium]